MAEAAEAQHADVPSEEDSLVEIPNEDLIFYSNFYKDHRDFCYADFCIANGARINRESPEFPVKFLSPKTADKNSFTIIVIVEILKIYEISIFANDISNSDVRKHLSSGLNETRRFDFNTVDRNIVFKDIHESLYKIVRDFIVTKQLEVEEDVKFCIYKLSKEVARSLDTDSFKFPFEERLRLLVPDDAFKIAYRWDNFGRGTYFYRMIPMTGGYGVYSIIDEKLLSFALRTMTGTIDYVQTYKRAARKGYASYIVKLLAKDFEKRGQDTIAMVRINDKEGKMFFKKLGFKHSGYSHNIYLKRQSLLPGMLEYADLEKKRKWNIPLPKIFQKTKKDTLEAGPSSSASVPSPPDKTHKPPVQPSYKIHPRLEVQTSRTLKTSPEVHIDLDEPASYCNLSSIELPTSHRVKKTPEIHTGLEDQPSYCDLSSLEDQSSHCNLSSLEVQISTEVHISHDTQTSHEVPMSPEVKKSPEVHTDLEAQASYCNLPSGEVQASQGTQRSHEVGTSYYNLSVEQVQTSPEVRTRHDIQTSRQGQTSCYNLTIHKVQTSAKVQTGHEVKISAKFQASSESNLESSSERETTDESTLISSTSKKSPFKSFSKRSFKSGLSKLKDFSSNVLNTSLTKMGISPPASTSPSSPASSLSPGSSPLPFSPTSTRQVPSSPLRLSSEIPTPTTSISTDPNPPSAGSTSTTPKRHRTKTPRPSRRHF